MLINKNPPTGLLEEEKGPGRTLRHSQARQDI